MKRLRKWSENFAGNERTDFAVLHLVGEHCRLSRRWTSRLLDSHHGVGLLLSPDDEGSSFYIRHHERHRNLRRDNRQLDCWPERQFGSVEPTPILLFGLALTFRLTAKRNVEHLGHNQYLHSANSVQRNMGRKNARNRFDRVAVIRSVGKRQRTFLLKIIQIRMKRKDFAKDYNSRNYDFLFLMHICFYIVGREKNIIRNFGIQKSFSQCVAHECHC